MKYTTLGNSGIEISRICVGCMGFGDAKQGMHSWTLDPDASREIIKYALDKGINFFDTAIAYSNGTSEQYVGKALRELMPRDKVVLATKFPPRPADSELSGEKYVEKMLDTSLENLGMDYIDLYILHSWDYNTPIVELLSGLNNAVKAGKVRAIGVSNCFAYQLAKANAIAEREGFPKFVSIQGHHNLIFREEECEMARLCREDNIAQTPYSALAAGRLARLPEGEATARLQQDTFAAGKYDATAEQDEIIIRRVAEIAEKRGSSMTEIALAWLLTRTTSPIVGMTKPHHVDGAVNATEIELTTEEIAYLEEPYAPHKLVGVMAGAK